MRVPLICALLVSAVCAKTDSLTTARLISEKINVLGMLNKTSTNESAFSYFIAAAANETLGKLQIIADLEQQLEIDNQMKGKLCMRNLTDCMANGEWRTWMRGCCPGDGLSFLYVFCLRQPVACVHLIALLLSLHCAASRSVSSSSCMFTFIN